MSREIKFRAVISEDCIIHFSLADMCNTRFTNRELLWPWLLEGNKPDDFIDQRDRNGTEIYEGDVVKGHVLPMVVEWDKRTASFVTSSSKGNFVCFGMRASDTEKEYEVIGNIHENPELLESA